MPTYVVTLHPNHDPDDPSGIRRLRAALKRFLRTFGLRCKGITTKPSARKKQEQSK
jgi:hypothetical protein